MKVVKFCLKFRREDFTVLISGGVFNSYCLIDPLLYVIRLVCTSLTSISDSVMYKKLLTIVPAYFRVFVAILWSSHFIIKSYPEWNTRTPIHNSKLYPILY